MKIFGFDIRKRKKREGGRYGINRGENHRRINDEELTVSSRNGNEISHIKALRRSSIQDRQLTEKADNTDSRFDELGKGENVHKCRRAKRRHRTADGKYGVGHIAVRFVCAAMALAAFTVCFGALADEVNGADPAGLLMRKIFGDDGSLGAGLAGMLVIRNFPDISGREPEDNSNSDASDGSSSVPPEDNKKSPGNEANSGDSYGNGTSAGTYGDGRSSESGHGSLPTGGNSDSAGKESDINSASPTGKDSGNGTDGGSNPTEGRDTGRSLYDFDYSAVPSGLLPIIPMDLSLSKYGSNYIHNDTGYGISVQAMLKADSVPAFDFGSAAVYPTGNPLVLIIHTHGTEAYSPDGAIGYDDSGEIARSSDTSKNVVAVGARITEILNQNHIVTVHCSVMHDAESYRNSYNKAAETIKHYLAEYPSIEYVIDVHRDSVMKSTGELVRPVTEAGEKACAQVMFVVGSDYGGVCHPEWENNLSMALKMREALNTKVPGICRPVCLRGTTYNQEMSYRSFLIEVGASGNSLEESLTAAGYVAEILSETIKGK